MRDYQDLFSSISIYPSSTSFNALVAQGSVKMGFGEEGAVKEDLVGEGVLSIKLNLLLWEFTEKIIQIKVRIAKMRDIPMAIDWFVPLNFPILYLVYQRNFDLSNLKENGETEELLDKKMRRLPTSLPSSFHFSHCFFPCSLGFYLYFFCGYLPSSFISITQSIWVNSSFSHSFFCSV